MFTYAKIVLALAAAMPAVMTQAATVAHVSADDAIRQAEAVVVGRLIDIGKERQLHVESTSGEQGEVQRYEETLYVARFEVSKLLDGKLRQESVTVFLPARLLEKQSDNNGWEAFVAGKEVLVGLSTDQMARRRDLKGYNVVHGLAIAVNDPNMMDALSERVAKLRPKPEKSLDMELEQAFGGSGTGDDVNLEKPKPEIDHKGATDRGQTENLPLDPGTLEAEPLHAKPVKPK